MSVTIPSFILFDFDFAFAFPFGEKLIDDGGRN